MATLSVTNTFSNGTVADAPQVNTNFNDIVDYINDRNDGTEDWEICNVTATAAAAMTISSNQATTEVTINNTATDGDPVLKWNLSGTTQFALGVDDGASDVLKLGTTAIGTGTIMTIESGGDIGIGTTDPDGILHLDNGTSNTVLVMEKDATTVAKIEFHSVGAEVGSVFCSASEDIHIQNITQDQDIFLEVNDGGVNQTIMKCNGDTSAVQFRDGLVGAPSISFLNDVDSGFYLVGANNVGLSLGGSLEYDFTSSRLSVLIDGSAATPAIVLGADEDTGLFRATANEFSIAAGGVESARFDNVSVQFKDGAAATPSIRFISDPDTGIFSEAANQIGFAAAGVRSVIITSAAIQLASGSVTVPSLTFISDPDSGFYSPSADIIAITTGGVRSGQFEDPADLSATETALSLYDKDNAALQQVTVGAADSGGSGFKVLRIPN